MADQVDEIKQKVDIVSLLGEYISLKKAGRNYKALCPFHGEKTPSFMVSPELQIYKCFGCGESGDVFSFLEKYEGMEFREALKFLADRVGVKLISYHPGEETEKERLIQINTWASKLYSWILLNHPKAKFALNYLISQRGLKLATIKEFQLGFSPDVPGVLRKFLVEKKKFNPKEIERAGLGIPRQDDIFDRFRGRVIFPLFDHRGNIVGFAGRTLPNSNPDLAKYINSPETPVYIKGRTLYGLNFTKDEIKKEASVVVVEGELDMISSWQAGVKNVIAIKGSALTEDQARLISRFSRKVILALDTDFAGDTAARRGIVIGQKEGLELSVARLGKYKDPDDAARADPEFYKKALTNAVGVWDFILDVIFSRYDAKSGEGKAGISKEIVPVLASIPDKIVQAHYTEEAAKRLGVPTEAVREEIETQESQEGAVEVIKPPKTTSQKTRRQLLEERLLTLAFQSTQEILKDEKIKSLVVTPLTARILEEYNKFVQKHSTFSPSEFAEGLPKELVEGFAEMALRDIEELVDDPDSLKRELDLVLRELKVIDIRHKLEVLGVKIRQFEEEGKREKSTDAQRKFGELTKTLSKLEEKGEGSIILQEV